jgi:hypothetical protein
MINEVTKFLMLALAGTALAAMLLTPAPTPAGPLPAQPTAASCEVPPPVARPRMDEEGCREAPLPALARR